MTDEETTKQFKESVLRDAPRLTINDEFQFACHPGVSCFNTCCSDVNIFLTPYDIVRIKNRLGISSEEFLNEYAIVPFSKEQRLPVVVIKMSSEEDKSCPFVSEKGCGVYEDRPWACRMYPLGMASPGEYEEGAEAFFFLMEEEGCEGFKEGKTQKISEWFEDQGVAEYDEMGELFKKFSTHPKLQGDADLSLSQMDMVHMACYDLDKFRKFVFESSLLDKIEVSDERGEAMKTDDVELMKFALEWLRFSICGERVLDIKSDVRSEKEEELSGVIEARRKAAQKTKEEDERKKNR